jgi:hypothetical protein
MGYYTLADVPQFDQWGLWFHRNAGFSCAGTPKATVVALVEGSAAEMSPKELLALLELPVANALYNTLHALRQEARIERQELGGYHLYVSAARQRANQQLMARRQAMDQEPSAPVLVSEDTLIAVLVEALQGAELSVSAATVASRLAARGVAAPLRQRAPNPGAAAGARIGTALPLAFERSAAPDRAGAHRQPRGARV